MIFNVVIISMVNVVLFWINGIFGVCNVWSINVCVYRDLINYFVWNNVIKIICCELFNVWKFLLIIVG